MEDKVWSLFLSLRAKCDGEPIVARIVEKYELSEDEVLRHLEAHGLPPAQVRAIEADCAEAKKRNDLTNAQKELLERRREQRIRCDSDAFAEIAKRALLAKLNGAVVYARPASSPPEPRPVVAKAPPQSRAMQVRLRRNRVVELFRRGIPLADISEQVGVLVTTVVADLDARKIERRRDVIIGKDGKKKPYRGGASSDRQAIEQRRDQVVELHLDGVRIALIAKRIGWSERTVRADLMARGLRSQDGAGNAYGLEAAE